MKAYYTSGTVGDAYIILCKVYSVAKKEKILCRHYTKYESLRPIIKDIYSLIPSIGVEFINERSSDVELIGAFHYQGKEREKNRYNLEPEYYPEFELGNINHFNLPKSYVTLQIKSGTHGENSQSLSMDIIKKILDDSKLPVVIIGEKTIDLPPGNFSMLDLRGNTTIKEVINIIKNSKHYYGLPGFLSFVAVSHKIMSDVHITFPKHINAMKARTEAVKEWREFLIKR